MPAQVSAPSRPLRNRAGRSPSAWLGSTRMRLSTLRWGHRGIASGGTQHMSTWLQIPLRSVQGQLPWQLCCHMPCSSHTRFSAYKCTPAAASSPCSRHRPQRPAHAAGTAGSHQPMQPAAAGTASSSQPMQPAASAGAPGHILVQHKVKMDAVHQVGGRLVVLRENTDRAFVKA